MREFLIDSQEAQSPQGNRQFDYYITVDEMEISPRIFCESYGAKVVEPGVDRASAHNLTTSAQRIDHLIPRCHRRLAVAIRANPQKGGWGITNDTLYNISVYL